MSTPRYIFNWHISCFHYIWHADGNVDQSVADAGLLGRVHLIFSGQ
ncbi:hypothetical protein [Stieleria bergensis]